MLSCRHLTGHGLLRLAVAWTLAIAGSGKLAYALDDPATPVKGSGAGRIVTVLAAREEGEQEWIVALEPETSRWERIMPGRPSARVSPDGKSVAFGVGVAVMTCPLRTGAMPKKVGDVGEPEAMQLASVAIAWTSDGRALLATGQRGEFPNTTGVTQRIDLASGAPKKVSIPETDAIDDVTSDGRWLLTSRTVGAIPRGVFKLRLDGTGEMQVAPGNAFCARVSPDGTKVLYTAYLDSGGETGGLFVIDIQGLNRRRVHDRPAYGCWSPDGNRIAQTGIPGPPVAIDAAAKAAPREDESRFVGRVVLMDLDGKNRVVHSTPGEALAFQPDWR
jgi:hypothetical protein